MAGPKGVSNIKVTRPQSGPGRVLLCGVMIPPSVVYFALVKETWLIVTGVILIKRQVPVVR